MDPHALCTRLETQDIKARPAWKPMHLQPVFEGVPVIGGQVSVYIYDRGVCLPSGSSMSDDDLDRLIDAVKEALAG